MTTKKKTRSGGLIHLFENINSQCKIDANLHLLKIDAGGGTATVEPAKLDCYIVAIKLDAHIATITKNKLSNSRMSRFIEKISEHFQTVNKF